ncbi:aldehyde oxidase GLOX1-like [Apium graveolens]|uniref:aldehyde oxidase GLOX1-like n=1 Tax=Apium graveolens TaxID=4045 RepID=UPI003D798EB3
MWQLVLVVLAAAISLSCAATAGGGKWDMLVQNVGVSAMHMQLLNNNRVIMFDRTDFGNSNISLPDHKCVTYRSSHNGTLKVDCTAHSVEYDIRTNSIRPLTILTDIWCSSGAVMADGRLVQTGGYYDGDHAVRVFKPCNNGSCDWKENVSGLTKRRWYATNHILPDGRQIIIGGRRQFNYEFYPKTGSTTSYSLPFLVQTNEPRIENNLYPFVFLNVDGNLFIFANNRSILFNYLKSVVVRTYPDVPGGDPRSYPSTGSAVLLPLKITEGDKIEAEVMVCGGAPKGSYISANNGIEFVQALDSCGRIKINDAKPQWVMEKMPMPRVMGDMLLLPSAKVLIINGASAGTAGWELGRNPVLSPVLYSPDNRIGSRFEVQNPSKIPRMYHSSTILLSDGRVLVGGSNPNVKYDFTRVLFPTELSLESFSPPYLDPRSAYLRPTIISPVTRIKIGYGQQLPIRFSVPGKVKMNLVTVTMVAPSFTTHSFSMNQRLLVLKSEDVKIVGRSKYQIRVVTPGSGNLAPSGYYMIFVVHQEIPSEAIWVKIQ